MPLSNTLYYGDNLTIMREKIPSQSVDLIYLDPPFKSDQNYNLIYQTLTGKPLPEQAEAFCDTWDMDAEKAELAKRIPQMMADVGVEDYYITFWTMWVNSLQKVQPHLLAYLIYMVQRLIYMKPILKDTGSIYLHCDPTASHYIKVMMDGIFGHKNFRNEIIWRRTGAHSARRTFGPIHDTILFYSKSSNYHFSPQKRPYMRGHVERRYKKDSTGRYKFTSGGNVLTGKGTTKGESGQPWQGVDPSAKNRHWAIPGFLAAQMPPEFASLGVLAKLDALLEAGLIDLNPGAAWPTPVRFLGDGDGAPVPDVWSYQPYTEGTLAGTDVGIDHDVRWLGPTDPERLGYPTQKPIGLLKRIIAASSRPGDVIFDPFCGCGTTIYATQELGHRTWVGCDVAILAIKLIRENLTEKYRLAEGTDYSVDGIPPSVEAARELFEKDAHQFQHWAVERVGGFPLKKRGADKGIDGRIYFESKPGLRSMVISVKGGHTGPAHVRELGHTVNVEPDADLGGFICLQEPTKAMRAAASDAGMFTYNGVDYPRLQVLCIREILEEKREFKTPTKIGSRISTGQKNLSFD